MPGSRRFEAGLRRMHALEVEMTFLARTRRAFKRLAPGLLLAWPLAAGSGSNGAADEPYPGQGALPRPFDQGLDYPWHLHVDASSPAGGNGSAGAPFRSIAEALAGVKPGTRIHVATGRYGAIGTVSGLQGTDRAPIAIVGHGSVVVDTGRSGIALRLVDPRFVVIEGLTIEGTAPHGINIDDGGSYESPAEHVVLRNMSFRNVGDGGNNDCLKMSGVDWFHVEDSSFEGCNRGEAIDMVGCHHGVVRGNVFAATPGTAVQAKGGSSDILIHGNRFRGIAGRAINAGGSTGDPYFRPLDARHEAERIRVIANVIEDTGGTPVAFSGCFECVFAHNTVVGPGRHAARIIEENRSRAPGTGGHFLNNVIVLRSYDGSALIDTDPAAEAGSFSFGPNLWHAEDGTLGPDAILIPGRRVETESVTGRDPLLDPAGRPSRSSPALQKGRTVPQGSLVDIVGRPFGPLPNLGAYAEPADPGPS